MQRPCSIAQPAPASPVSQDQPLAEYVEAIRSLGKRVAGDIVEIGRHLVACREIVGHGNWLLWLEREFGWSDQTARNFINLYELGNSNSKRVLNLNLPLRDLYRLAAPSTSEQVRAEVIARAEAGEKITPATITEILPPVPTQLRTKKANKLTHREARRMTKLEEAYDHIRNTSLGSSREMDALVKVKDSSSEEAERLIEQARAGRAVSAIAVIEEKARQPKPTHEDLVEAWKHSRILSLWERAHIAARVKFLSDLLTPAEIGFLQRAPVSS